MADYADVWRTGPPGVRQVAPQALPQPVPQALPQPPAVALPTGPTGLAGSALGFLPAAPAALSAAPPVPITNNFYYGAPHPPSWGNGPPQQAPAPAPVVTAAPATPMSWPYFWPVFAIVVAVVFFILYVVHVCAGKKTNRLLKEAIRLHARMQAYPPPPLPPLYRGVSSRYSSAA